MLGLLAISVLTLLNTNPASANELHDEASANVEIESINRQVWEERRYSTSEYNNDPTTFGYNPFPTSIWYSHAGYAGYIYVDSYYKSSTHYIVTYGGVVRQGPFVPLADYLLND